MYVLIIICYCIGEHKKQNKNYWSLKILTTNVYPKNLWRKIWDEIDTKYDQTTSEEQRFPSE